MSDKYKVGDQVFDLRCGFGKIVDYSDLDNFCIVEYNRNLVIDYCSNGYMDSEDFAPSLLTLSEAKALGYEPPKKKVKKTMYANVYLEDNYYLSGFYKTKELAEKASSFDLISIAEVTFEVDETENYHASTSAKFQKENGYNRNKEQDIE